MAQVTLVSKSGSKHSIASAFLKDSELISTMLEDLDVQGNEEIQLENLEEETISQVVNYLNEYHANKDKALNEGKSFLPEVELSDSSKYTPDEWEIKYIPSDAGKLLKLVDASNFLGIKALINLTFAEFGRTYLQNKTAEDIESIFGIALSDEVKDFIKENNRFK